MRAAAVSLAMPLALGASCAPDACATARRGFVALEPATEAILAYEDRTGRLPDDLADAGIAMGPDVPPGADLAFASGREVVPVRWGPVAGGDAEPALAFDYTGPGMNVCTWTASTRAWSCRGHY